jgi:uncharacterized protein YjbI with pentapeptide repeats
MANLEHLAILKKGTAAWNHWRVRNRYAQSPLSRIELSDSALEPDLAGAEFGNADLCGADLTLTDLRGASLRRANLSEADLSLANLHGANLSEAQLDHALLDRTDLSSSKLIWTSFHHAILMGVDASDAQFSGWLEPYQDVFVFEGGHVAARFGGTVLSYVNLTDAKGLEDCDHAGPSMIDHRTVAKSRTLPLKFLRGCGLPDQLIEFFPSILNQPIQFYSCFISYSTKDHGFATRLHADLQNKGVRCWFAPHDMRGGRKLHDQIDEAIRVYDRMLLILSGDSMDSEWVKTETAHARQKELNEKRRVLFPISVVPFESIHCWRCFDADTGKDSAREIREYFIPDFSNWQRGLRVLYRNRSGR